MTEGIATSELEVADTIGKLMQFWGFKRPMGRIWTLLYLSPKPLAAADISAALLMSSGAVSMALTELERWGAVHRTWTPGERRDFFQAEASVWKLVQRVLRERELMLVREFREALEKAAQNVESSEKKLSKDSHFEGLSERLSYKRARLRRLGELAQSGETLLSALVEGGAIDPTKLLSPTENLP